MSVENLPQYGLLTPIRDNPGFKEVATALAKVYDRGRPVGTGFLIEDNGLYFVSANHVLRTNCDEDFDDDCEEERRIFFASGEEIITDPEQITFMSDRDLSFIRLEDSVIPASLVPLRRSRHLAMLEKMEGLSTEAIDDFITFSFGFPYSYLRYHKLDEIPLYSVGQVLEVRRTQGSYNPESKPTLLTLSNRAESGMSGGPVLDDEYGVVAVNSSKPGGMGTSLMRLYRDNYELYSSYNCFETALFPGRSLQQYIK